MKRLLVLLCVFSVFAIFTASPLMAARPSLNSRMQTLMAILWQNVFPFSGSFYYAIDSGLASEDYRGYMLGGDADDLANGRSNGDPIIDPKSPTRTLRDDGVREPRTPESGMIYKPE